jgi:tetratricopeptide (TPR) repeat protein
VRPRRAARERPGARALLAASAAAGRRTPRQARAAAAILFTGALALGAASCGRTGGAEEPSGDAAAGPTPSAGSTTDGPSIAGSSSAGTAADAPLPTGAALAADARLEIEAARDAALAAPDDGAAWLGYAMRLDANGLDDLAPGAYARAAELRPDDPRPPYHAALARAEVGAYADALASLERALERDGSYAPAHRHRGGILLVLGRPADARAAFARARELDPRDPGAALFDARACLELGRPADALALVDAVLARGELGYARHLRAAALRELGRADEAASDAARADGGTPAWSDPWDREVRALRGGPRMRLARARALIGAGRAAEALALLGADRGWDELVAGGDVGAIGAAAAALCAQGRRADALRLARDAEAALPRHNRAPLVTSEVHAAAGDLTAAIAAARRSLALQPDLALAHEQLAALLAAAGDAEGASAARAEAERLAGLPAPEEDRR